MVLVSPLKTSWLIAQGKLAGIDNTSTQFVHAPVVMLYQKP